MHQSCPWSIRHFALSSRPIFVSVILSLLFYSQHWYNLTSLSPFSRPTDSSPLATTVATRMRKWLSPTTTTLWSSSQPATSKRARKYAFPTWKSVRETEVGIPGGNNWWKIMCSSVNVISARRRRTRMTSLVMRRRKKKILKMRWNRKKWELSKCPKCDKSRFPITL